MQREKLMRKNSGYQRPSLVSLLQRDTADRAGYRAEVTGYATLFAVRIAGQNDTTTITGRQIDRLFRYIRVSRLANACRPIIQILRTRYRNLLTILLRSWSYCSLLRLPENDSRRYQQVDQRQRQADFPAEGHYRHNADAVTTHESK